MWYIFPVECDEKRIDHQTLLLVVTMPCACWFLWRTNHIEDFQVTSSFCNLGLRFEGLFGERYYILKGQITFEGHWRLQSWTLVSSSFIMWSVLLPETQNKEQGQCCGKPETSGTLILRPLYTLHLHRFATSIQVVVPAMAGENFGHNRSRPIPNVSKSNRWHVDIFRLFLSLVSSFMPPSHPTFATPKKGFLKFSSLYTIDII